MKQLLLAFLILGHISATATVVKQNQGSVKPPEFKDKDKKPITPTDEKHILHSSWREKLRARNSLKPNERSKYILSDHVLSQYTNTGYLLKKDDTLAYYMDKLDINKLQSDGSVLTLSPANKRFSDSPVYVDKPLFFQVSRGNRIMPPVEDSKIIIDDGFKQGKYLELRQVLPVQVAGRQNIYLHLQEQVINSDPKPIFKWYEYWNSINDLLQVLKEYINGNNDKREVEQNITLFSLDEIQAWSLERYGLGKIGLQKIRIKFTISRDNDVYNMNYECGETNIVTLPIWDDKIQYKIEFDKDIKGYVLVNTETKAKYYIEVLRQSSGLRNPEEVSLGTCSYSDLDKFRRFEKSAIDVFPIKGGKPVTFELNPIMPAGTSGLLGYLVKPYLAISIKK